MIRLPVRHCPRRGNVLLGQHPGDLRGAVPGEAQTVNLLHHGCGLRVNDEVSVRAFQIAIDRLACDRHTACSFRSDYCSDFLACIAHKPFVKQVPQGAHVVVALGAVHAVIDGDKADALLGEGDLCK